MSENNAVDRLAHDADQLAQQRRRVPLATYRLQMNAGFTLGDALRIAPYLESVGISHVYTSPMQTAKAGSTHGYDVIDHSRLNPEIGTDEQLDRWIADLRARGMGWIIDTVPNHMSVGGPNEWWSDVLEHGPASAFAGYFDIAWDGHPRERLHGKVLLPILGQPYGVEIEAGRFRVAFDDRVLSIFYYELRLPIDPRTYSSILSPVLDTLREQLGPDDADIAELQSILTAVKNLPPRSDAERSAEGCAECRVIKRRLADLAARNPAFDEQIQASTAKISGVVGDPASFVALEELLEAQAYRPSYWRVASDEINYRRFFDINDLAALSTEREEVFAAIHRKTFEWIMAGQLDGLRIDHPDGLFDPKQYLDRLQLYARLAAAQDLLRTKPESYGELTWETAEGALGERFAEMTDRPLYVVVEKILSEGESLPPDWATDGTTGYEFINLLNGLFVDQANEAAMSRHYRELTEFDERFDDLVYTSKFHILQSTLSSELHMLSHQLDRIAQAERWSRDFTLNGLRHALREVIACFPVYRSYVNGGVSDKDRLVILRAIARARSRNPLLGRSVFDFVRDTLLLKDPPSGPATPDYRAAQRRFAGKFQQVTSPAMAKGFEDTALYIHSRLISLNEVGGDPSRFGRAPAELHHFLADRAATSPAALSPLSTHDTKRSEDVRARINVLSEMPNQWAERTATWMEWNREFKIEVDGSPAPDANEEYFLYQTLIGAWPLEGLNEGNRADFVRRIQEYVVKALHEAKVHSSWINPNSEYDEAAVEFIKRILDPTISGRFIADFEQFQRGVSDLGMINSLAQTLIRATAPGVPDTYQGTELWDFSLVDPDNRRPVDFNLRTRLLAELDAAAEHDRLGLARKLAESRHDGRIKLYVLAQALRMRRSCADLFARGSYTPVDVVGPRAGHVFCFVRSMGEVEALVATPRLLAGLPVEERIWNGTVLAFPDQTNVATWRNHLTGEIVTSGPDRTLPLAQIFAHFPVALLERQRQ